MAESSTATSTTTIASLPPEIMAKIFDKLSVPDKCQCTLVCVDWRNKFCNKIIWHDATFTWTRNMALPEGSPILKWLISRNIRRLAIDVNFDAEPAPLDGIIRFLPQVESLRINNMVMENSLLDEPSFVSALTRLIKLTIVDCHLINSICLAAITSSFKNLVSLEFVNGVDSSMGVSDNCLMQIARNLSNLTRLTLDNCATVTDSGIKQLTHHGRDKNCNLPRLQYLSLGKCEKITATSMSYLSVGQPYLTYLCIAHTEKVTNVGIAHLSNLKHLQEFVFLPRFTIIADKDVDYLASLRQLSVLRFRCRKWRVMLEYRQLAKMDNLRVMELHYFDFFSKKVWTHFAKMTNLSELSLYESLISDDNLSALADAGSRLVKLEITGIGTHTIITDNGLKHIARLSQLRELALINCRNLRGTGLAHLAEGVAKIAIFKLGTFENFISFSALVHIAGFSHLRTLTWFGGHLAQVDEHIDTFKQNRPDVLFRLKKLNCASNGLEKESPHMRIARDCP